MKRYLLIGKKKSRWLFFGALLYVLVLLLGLGNAVYTAAAGREKLVPIYSVQREDKAVAITFNCAFEQNNIPEILAVLKKRNIRATFFILGEWMQWYPQMVKEIADDGHTLGNHSFYHKDFVHASEQTIQNELDKTNEMMKILTGKTPWLVRVPSGSYDNRVIRYLRDGGYEVIQWDVDSVDRVCVTAKKLILTPF